MSRSKPLGGEEASSTSWNCTGLCGGDSMRASAVGWGSLPSDVLVLKCEEKGIVIWAMECAD